MLNETVKLPRDFDVHGPEANEHRRKRTDPTQARVDALLAAVNGQNVSGHVAAKESPAPDLFSEDLRSYPPRIVELRRFYDEAKAAYDAADAHEDESGEEIPREIQMDYHHWERQLRIEEARVALENDLLSGAAPTPSNPIHE